MLWYFKMKNRKFLFIIFIILIFLSCSSPKIDFKKAKDKNTIEAFESFLDKYPESNYTEMAVNLRDQLAFDIVQKTNPVGRLDTLENNALQNLVANAEKAEKTGDQLWETNSLKAAGNYANAGDYYTFAAKVKTVLSGDSTQMYRKAGMAYYRASVACRNAELESFAAVFKRWVRSADSPEKLHDETAEAIAPHHLNKAVLFNQSVQCFRKIGISLPYDLEDAGYVVRRLERESSESDSLSIERKNIH